MALEDVQFFGNADRQGKTDKGKLTSEYPAWYFLPHIDELVEDIQHKERALEMGAVPPSEIPYAKEELKKQKDMLERVSKRPELTAKDKDEAYKIYKKLANGIADSMFSRTEMKKGLADAHEEARRMTEPVIDLYGSTKLMKSMGITPKMGKLSRNQASRAFKIIGKLLGEPTNTEILRKDYAHGTYHSEVPLEEMR